MKRLASSLILSGAIAIAGAQNQPTSGAAPGQTMTGVLMDATCAAIGGGQAGGLQSYSASPASRSATTAVTSNDAVQNSSTSTSSVTHSGRSSPTEGIRTNSASTQGATGAADTTGSTVGRANTDPTSNASARAADERRRMGSNTSGTGEVAGAANSSVSTARNSSVTDRNASTGSTSGANSASALGTTGAATDSATAPVGQRSRSIDSGSSTASVTTSVREKFSGCVPTANTTSFALHSSGQLYILDPASNDMVRQQMSGEAFRGAMHGADGQPQWMTVTVMGTPGSNNHLTITSIRK